MTGIDIIMGRRPALARDSRYFAVFKAKTPTVEKENPTEHAAESLQTEGIFRLSGSTRELITLANLFKDPNTSPKRAEFSSFNIHSITTFIKKYLMQLPEPVIPRSFQRKIELVFESDCDSTAKLESIVDIGMSMPDAHNQLLRYILDLLISIIALQERNKMNPEALAVVFAPTLSFQSSMRDNESSSSEDSVDLLTGPLLQHNAKWIKIWQFVLENSHQLMRAWQEKLFTVRQAAEALRMAHTIQQRRISKAPSIRTTSGAPNLLLKQSNAPIIGLSHENVLVNPSAGNNINRSLSKHSRDEKSFRRSSLARRQRMSSALAALVDATQLGDQCTNTDLVSHERTLPVLPPAQDAPVITAVKVARSTSTISARRKLSVRMDRNGTLRKSKANISKPLPLIPHTEESVVDKVPTRKRKVRRFLAFAFFF